MKGTFEEQQQQNGEPSKQCWSLEVATSLLISLRNREIKKCGNKPSGPKQGADLDARLASGKSLGNVYFTSIVNGVGHRFRCTSNCIGGRGLRVFDHVSKGVTLARGAGKVVSRDEALAATTSFKIYDSKGKYLLIDPPTTAMPAHLANTSDGSVANNCRIAHKAGSSYFSIITLRALEPGEEVLVAYGSKFTGTVREVAKEEHRMRTMENKMSCNMLVRCVLCNSLIKKRLLKYHSKLVCRRKQNVLLS
jgi:hypothetical protein